MHLLKTALIDITDQVAKESKDSTASSHPMHQEDTGVTSGGSSKATIQDHKATPVSTKRCVVESIKEKFSYYTGTCHIREPRRASQQG